MRYHPSGLRWQAVCAPQLPPVGAGATARAGAGPDGSGWALTSALPPAVGAGGQ
jgi:hypothetical protein